MPIAFFIVLLQKSFYAKDSEIIAYIRKLIKDVKMYYIIGLTFLLASTSTIFSTIFSL